MAVFGLPGIVGMAGPVSFGQMSVVAGALVFIGNQKGDGSTGCPALEYAAKHLYGIAFLSLGDDGALPGPAPVEFVLNIVQVEIQSCGAAIYNTADGRAM